MVDKLPKLPLTRSSCLNCGTYTFMLYCDSCIMLGKPRRPEVDGPVSTDRKWNDVSIPHRVPHPFQ